MREQIEAALSELKDIVLVLDLEDPRKNVFIKKYLRKIKTSLRKLQSSFEDESFDKKKQKEMFK